MLALPGRGVCQGSRWDGAGDGCWQGEAVWSSKICKIVRAVMGDKQAGSSERFIEVITQLQEGCAEGIRLKHGGAKETALKLSIMLLDSTDHGVSFE